MTSSPPPARRRRVVRAAVAVLAVPAAVVIWAVGVEPRFVAIETIEASVPALPASWEGKRIAVVADLQRGMWLNNNDTARRAVSRIVDLQPEAVLIPGDLIFNTAETGAREEIPGVVDTLRPLRAANIPVFVALGNHDYGLMEPESLPDEALARELAAALEGIGVEVLRNEVRAFRGRDSSMDPLYLVGVDDAWARKDRPSEALAQVPRGAPRIVFMHAPSSFEKIAPGEAPLGFAAHTHGGQIRVPFTGKKTWRTWIRGRGQRLDGWMDLGAPGNRLYITRGIGFSHLPVRFNCAPELTVVTLRR